MTRIPALRLSALCLFLPAAACVGQLASDSMDPQAPAPTGPGKSAALPTTNAPATEPAKPGAMAPSANPSPVAAEPAVAKLPFAALSPAAYGAKIKDLLTGLPLKDEERRLITADPKPEKVRTVLRPMIDQWMALPEFRGKTLHFFKNAFQQTQLDRSDLDEQLKLSSNGISAAEQNKMLKSVEESFAQTALGLVDEGRPFTETVTTHRFRLNVPMMAALAYMDAAPQTDLNAAYLPGYWILNKYPKEKPFTYTQTANLDGAGIPVPIPFEDSINPASPNFMVFAYTPPVMKAGDKPCVDPAVQKSAAAINYVFRALFGNRAACNGAVAPSVFTADDWNTWKWVTIRAPKDGEERSIFWEVPKFRDPAFKDLVLATPRVGFMTTLAFFANWPTNLSNQYRVTLNQALIVGLGRSFDDSAVTVQVSESSVDTQHASDGVCLGCHRTLDPMRDFFKQTYTLTYSQQLDMKNPKNPIPEVATFSVDGVAPMSGKGIDVLAKALVDHPRFAPAWTQKLCTLANSEACVEDDPEFVRVAALFKKSSFNFKTLVRELMVSPLVTFAEKGKSADETGVVMSIARRETWCARLSARLGVTDLCNQAGESTLPRIANQARNLAFGVPGSAYSRAEEKPLMPHDSNMFSVEATEKLCWAIALQLIDGGVTTKWAVKTQKDQAVVDMTEGLMGVVPSDPKHDAIIGLLNKHYADAVAAKETPSDALRSTFTVACSSPLGVATGL